jgi:hypothetical protein
MRLPVLAFFLIIVALLGNTEAGNKQSPSHIPGARSMLKEAAAER